MNNLVQVLLSPTLGAPTDPPTAGLASTLPSTKGLTQVLNSPSPPVNGPTSVGDTSTPPLNLTQVLANNPTTLRANGVSGS